METALSVSLSRHMHLPCFDLHQFFTCISLPLTYIFHLLLSQYSFVAPWLPWIFTPSPNLHQTTLPIASPLRLGILHTFWPSFLYCYLLLLICFFPGLPWIPSLFPWTLSLAPSYIFFSQHISILHLHCITIVIAFTLSLTCSWLRVGLLALFCCVPYIPHYSATWVRLYINIFMHSNNPMFHRY